MSSQLSYRLHGREQRPKTLRKHYRDELDTGQVKASAKVAESLFRKAVGDGPQSVFCARPYGQFRGTTQLLRRFSDVAPGKVQGGRMM
jgi:hypothetical protein